MRKMLVFVVFCIPLYAWGENAVFNPSFDMSPWDSGWTIEIDTFSTYNASAEVEVEPDSGKSLQNCCYLRTNCSIDAYPGGYAEANAKAMITQNFDGITGCMIKAYLKWDRDSWDKGAPGTYGMMKACINNEWKLIWENAYYTPTAETAWTEVCTTLAGNDILSGIRFFVRSRFYNGYYGSWYWCHSYLWIDDIYIGEVGVEESEKLRVTSHKLEVCPNPFVKFAEVRCQKSDVRIQVYDMMGRLVEETELGVIGKDLRAGVYFVKAGGYKPIKIIKLGRMQ